MKFGGILLLLGMTVNISDHYNASGFRNKKAQRITMDRLGFVVVCGGYKDRLLHQHGWCVSPPFNMVQGIHLYKGCLLWIDQSEKPLAILNRLF
jgi:hypothetical protein